MHPRALGSFASRDLDTVIPDEAELTAGVTHPSRPILRVLHRHHAVHRLQGLRGGVQGMEQPAGRNPVPDRPQLRQHRSAFRQHLAACPLHRDERARRQPDAVPERLADDERCLQALPQCTVPGGMSHRGAVPHGVRHRRGAAGYLQRLRLLRAGLSRSGWWTSARWMARRTNARLCYDRLKGGLEPACAKACPTDSIQFGEIDELQRRAQQRLEHLHRLARDIGLSVWHPRRTRGHGRARAPQCILSADGTPGDL